MPFRLEEACQFLSDLTINYVTILDSSEAIDRFCTAHHFHSSQKSFTPKGFRLLLKQLTDKNIISFRDVLRVHLILVLVEDTPVAIGPFCTEELNEAAVELLIRRYNIHHLPVKNYRAYLSAFPLRNENDVIRYARVLLKHLDPDTPPHAVETIKSDLPESPNERQYTRENFETLIHERYRVESEMVRMIRQGRTKEAVERYRYLHNNVRFMVRIGGTLESGRISSAITRTVIRVAAMQEGLPPVLIDQITGESANTISHAETREAMVRETEHLIRTMCEAVRRFRSEKYSLLTLSALYEIERHYQKPIRVEDTAEKLGVSTAHYIRTFKKETGVTPNTYLMKIRMQTASRLLRFAHYSIHEISDQVGITDANYFVKCFRREYGITPSDFRAGAAPVDL